MTLTELEQEVALLKQELTLVERHVANLPVRWAADEPAAATGLKYLTRSTLPAAGRGEYEAQEIGTVKTFKVYNLLESAVGTRFLDPTGLGDEFFALEKDGILIFAWSPRI